MLTLRRYQEEPVRKAIEYFNSNTDEPALIVLPTAWGKSVLTAFAAANIPPTEKLLVVQPTKELLEQNYNKFKALCGEEATAGIYSASFNKKEMYRITYATIGSIKTLGAEFKAMGYTKMLIDEAHLYPRKEESMLGQFLKDSGIRQVLGITATPLKLEQFQEKQGTRFDKWSELIMLTNPSPSGTFFKKILHCGQIQEMTLLGFWSPLIYEKLPFDRSMLNYNSTGSEFSEDSELKAYAFNNVRQNIYGALDYHKERKHVLVFVPSVEEATILASEYPSSAVISGETNKKERDIIIKDFRSGNIRVIFNVGVLSCLSEDTEILTRNGWKGNKEISYDDKIAEYENGKIFFEYPTNIIRKEYTGQMVTSENKYMNFCVTEDHDMIFTKQTTHGKFKPLNYCKASELTKGKYSFIPINGTAEPEKINIKTNTVNCSESRFIITNSYNYRKKGMTPKEARKQAEKLLQQRKDETPKNPNELTLNECRLIGFWLGDGSVFKSTKKGKRNGLRYNLSQSSCNPEMIKWVEDLLQKCEINYSKNIVCKEKTTNILGRNCHRSEAYSYQLYKGNGGHNQNKKSNLHKIIPYLQKNGTELFWGLNRDQFFALMEGFWKANGNHKNNKTYIGRKICSSNKQLLDLLQAIGVCRGYRIIISEITKREENKKQLYSISLSDLHFHEFVKNIPKYKKVENSTVWCVTVPKGTIVTRRKGRVSIMCNCGFDYPEIDMIICGFSTASVAKYYQILGRGVRIHPNKKNCLVVDMGGNVDRFGMVEDIFFKMGDKWRMYGSGGVLLTGLPINAIGTVNRLDINRIYTGIRDGNGRMNSCWSFGKYLGMNFKDTPMTYRVWTLNHMKQISTENRDGIIHSIENHVRDTRNDPPMDIMPSGQHAGVCIGLVPKGYLAWFYNAQEWNETNDSLRRGIELQYGGVPKYFTPAKKR